MNSEKGNKGDLKIQLDGVIEKSRAQKELLEKLLNHLTKQNTVDTETSENKKSKNK